MKLVYSFTKTCMDLKNTVFSVSDGRELFDLFYSQKKETINIVNLPFSWPCHNTISEFLFPCSTEINISESKININPSITVFEKIFYDTRQTFESDTELSCKITIYCRIFLAQCPCHYVIISKFLLTITLPIIVQVAKL